MTFYILIADIISVTLVCNELVVKIVAFLPILIIYIFF
jgi:hypothetical protein